MKAPATLFHLPVIYRELALTRPGISLDSEILCDPARVPAASRDGIEHLTSRFELLFVGLSNSLYVSPMVISKWRAWDQDWRNFAWGVIYATRISFCWKCQSMKQFSHYGIIVILQTILSTEDFDKKYTFVQITFNWKMTCTGFWVLCVCREYFRNLSFAFY